MPRQKRKTTKKATTRRAPAKKKATKKKTATRRAPTKKKTTKKKTSTRRAPTKKKAAKKKVTRRRSTTRSSPAKKARSRRTTTKKSTPRRAPAKRASSRRKSPAVYRGESGLRRFLSDLDAAIVKTDKWIATVNTQAANIAGGFDVQLHELAGLAAALESDQATIDALREDLDAIQVVTPAIKTLQQRLAGTSGTVMGIREELQRIAEIKAPGLLRIGGHGHLVGKAGCTMAASRHGTPPEHCGPGTMTPQMASQVLVAAREGDIPALCRWVVEAQVPLVSGGSIPPSDADVDAFRQGKTARPPRSSVRRARPPLARPKTPEPVPPALVTPPARAASPKPRTKSSSVDTGGPTPAQQQLELTVRKGLGV